MPYVTRYPDGSIKGLYSCEQFPGQEWIKPNGPEHQAWKHAQMKADADRQAKVDSWKQRMQNAKTMDALKAILMERL